MKNSQFLCSANWYRRYLVEIVEVEKKIVGRNRAKAQYKKWLQTMKNGENLLLPEKKLHKAYWAVIASLFANLEHRWVDLVLPVTHNNNT